MKGLGEESYGSRYTKNKKWNILKKSRSDGSSL